MSDLQPYGREDALWQYLNQIEQDLFAGLESLFGPFRSEFSDEGDRYLLKIALPGFRREDIRIEEKDGGLTVKAARREEKEGQKQAAAGFFRQFSLAGVRAEGIEASYRDGLLCLTLPKSRPEDGPPPRQIPIQ